MSTQNDGEESPYESDMVLDNYDDADDGDDIENIDKEDEDSKSAITFLVVVSRVRLGRPSEVRSAG